MSRIQDAFLKGKCLIPFITAGDPSLDKTVEYVLAMEEAGADIIEIGIPFSDPTAEGVVIQEASLRALQGGFTMEGLFDAVKKIREKSSIPLLFMTYINPVHHYGYDAFFAKCKELSVDGFLSPELPFEEKEEVAEVAKKYGVEVISMVSPTSEKRIERIAKEAEGFLYVVSSMGVTGVRTQFSSNLEETIKTIRSVSKVPCAIGFGISNPEQAAKMAGISDGAIVGSAIVRVIAQYGEQAKEPLKEFVASLKKAL
ncbi:MAG: tryptophan synthase subunit alpha [Lachnospiraceae bacterium]|nr:tryptophan synthase subunit alpha [Lachnospiraceae bacterium]